MASCNSRDVRKFDAAIIGGGVVGCAVARRLTLLGAQVILLEKAPDILAGASKGNSAILHTGFDAPAGSLELRLMQAGYREYIEIRSQLGLPLLETGAIVVAWTDEELAALPTIEAQAHANGVAAVRRLEKAEMHRLAPQLATAALGGLLVPGEHVIDPWSAPLAYIQQALLNGAEVRRNTEVIAGAFDGSAWSLTTNTGTISATVSATTVVNCAGLYGDIVDQRLTGRRYFNIRPRKGQFVVYDKIAARLLRSIILPVPTERSKGIVLVPTIFGNVLVGPTAEEQDDRAHATVERAVLQSLVAKAESIVPALRQVPVTATYAGLRPATEHKAYQTRTDKDRNLITIGGIRSTGLTSALGIAQHVAAAYSELGQPAKAAGNILWPVMPMLAEHEARDWTLPDHGEIVCHCELVTKREIEAALASPLPAADLAGLKRRTRAGMGRCQGFYCSAQIAAISQGRLAIPLATT